LAQGILIAFESKRFESVEQALFFRIQSESDFFHAHHVAPIRTECEIILKPNS